jgi:hypothetical protein
MCLRGAQKIKPANRTSSSGLTDDPDSDFSYVQSQCALALSLQDRQQQHVLI